MQQWNYFAYKVIVRCVIERVKLDVLWQNLFVLGRKSKDTLFDMEKDQFCWRRNHSSSSCCSCLHKASNVDNNDTAAPQTLGGTCLSCHLSPTPNSEINQVAENGFRNCANKKHNKGKKLFCVHAYVYHRLL